MNKLLSSVYQNAAKADIDTAELLLASVVSLANGGAVASHETEELHAEITALANKVRDHLKRRVRRALVQNRLKEAS